MIYFSRRNEYVVEYSGHEEVSEQFRKRIASILRRYVENNLPSYSNDRPWFVDPTRFSFEVQKEFPGRDPFRIIADGEFHEVFTVIEIFLSLSRNIYHTRRASSLGDVLQAFNLSGSVYQINEGLSVELRIENDVAEKIESVKDILAPYPEFSRRFFQAVGNLVGRRAKSEDIVKDIFVASEGYLKSVTETSRFGEAVKQLYKAGDISKEQKRVLEALHEFRSDADGAGHAGNSGKPNEESVLWFLETLVAQLRMIDKKTK